MVDLTPISLWIMQRIMPADFSEELCHMSWGWPEPWGWCKVYPDISATQKKYNIPSIESLTQIYRRVMPLFKYIDSTDLDRIMAFIRNEPIKPMRGMSKFLQDVPYSMTGYNRWTDPNGLPAVKPPWGTLNAINLNTGEYEWTVPLGEADSLTKKGIPSQVLKTMADFKYGRRPDFYRCIQRRTLQSIWWKDGKVLWQYQLCRRICNSCNLQHTWQTICGNSCRGWQDGYEEQINMWRSL